ncbi:MAG TPA: hypothetical protein VH297_12900 [Gaiellaceae bacterium]
MKIAVLAALALALVYAAPASAAPRLSKAERAQINATLDTFVNHGVKRVDIGASYDAVTPGLRGGMSRTQWAKGNIPVYPYPARGTTFHDWTIDYVTPGEIGIQLELLPPPARNKTLGPIIFHVYLHPVHGRWLVDLFMPSASLAPLGNKPRIIANNDFSPQAAGEGDVGHGPSRLNHGLLFIPFAAMGLVVLAFIAAVLRGFVRDRRVKGAGSKRLPPLPGVQRSAKSS